MSLRKIGDLRPWDWSGRCRDPEHNLPDTTALESGRYEHTCPGCGARTTFVVPERFSRFSLEVG